MLTWLNRLLRSATRDKPARANEFLQVAPDIWCLLAHPWPSEAQATPPWAARCEWVTWDEYCDAYDDYTEQRRDCLNGTDLLFTAPWQEYTDKYRLMIDATWDPDRERWMLLRKADTLVSYAERLRQPKRHAWDDGG